MPEDHIHKFYKHADGMLEFLSKVDYSELSRAREILGELDSLPEEMHEQIRQTVIDRLKAFYEIAVDHVKNYKPSDLRVIDELAVKGNIKALEAYGIIRKENAKGHPKAYEVAKRGDYKRTSIERPDKTESPLESS